MKTLKKQFIVLLLCIVVMSMSYAATDFTNRDFEQGSLGWSSYENRGGLLQWNYTDIVYNGTKSLRFFSPPVWFGDNAYIQQDDIALDNIIVHYYGACSAVPQPGFYTALNRWNSTSSSWNQIWKIGASEKCAQQWYTYNISTNYSEETDYMFTFAGDNAAISWYYAVIDAINIPATTTTTTTTTTTLCAIFSEIFIPEENEIGVNVSGFYSWEIFNGTSTDINVSLWDKCGGSIFDPYNNVYSASYNESNITYWDDVYSIIDVYYRNPPYNYGTTCAWYLLINDSVCTEAGLLGPFFYSTESEPTTTTTTPTTTTTLIPECSGTLVSTCSSQSEGSCNSSYRLFGSSYLQCYYSEGSCELGTDCTHTTTTTTTTLAPTTSTTVTTLNSTSSYHPDIPFFDCSNLTQHIRVGNWSQASWCGLVKPIGSEWAMGIIMIFIVFSAYKMTRSVMGSLMAGLLVSGVFISMFPPIFRYLIPVIVALIIAVLFALIYESRKKDKGGKE